MKIIRSPLNSFTMLPNELLRADCCLQPREIIVWAALQSLCREEGPDGYESDHFSRQADIARFLGITTTTLSRRLKDLRKCGALIELENGDWELAIPTITIDQRKNMAYSGLPGTESETMIGEEQAKLDKRPKTLSETDRKGLIRDAWNKHLPEGDIWIKIDGSVPPQAYWAIEEQTKFLNHDRDDYDGFIGQVCRGLKTNEYWMHRRTAPAKMWSVFGYLDRFKGEKHLTDSVFRRVKELYLMGNTKKGLSADFNGSDESFLAWFHRQGETKFTSVERIPTPGRIDAMEEEGSKAVDTTIRVYTDSDGDPVFWTLGGTQEFRYLP